MGMGGMGRSPQDRQHAYIVGYGMGMPMYGMGMGVGYPYGMLGGNPYVYSGMVGASPD